MDGLVDSKAIDALYQIQYMAYVQVAVTVAVFYDHFTTLDLEIELIWKKKWTFVTILFIVNRYFGEALPLYLTGDAILKPSSGQNNGECTGPRLKVGGWGCHVLIWSMQAIMQYRIFCIYKHSRRVILFVAVAFTAEVLSMIVTDWLYLPRTTMTAELHPGVHVCTGYATAWYLASWIPVFSYEVIILFLGIRAGISYFKETRSLPSLDRYPLHAILLCDSILYPIIAFAVGASNVSGWSRPTTYSMPVAAGLSQLFSRILGCRLILNLREAYYLPFQEECGGNEGRQTLIFIHTDDEAGRTE